MKSSAAEIFCYRAEWEIACTGLGRPALVLAALFSLHLQHVSPRFLKTLDCTCFTAFVVAVWHTKAPFISIFRY